MILLEIVFGFLGMLILMRFSRWREYRADAGSAGFLGREKMIASLQKLQKLSAQSKMFADKELQAAKISDESKFFGLFRSHPSLQQRIDRLSNMYV